MDHLGSVRLVTDAAGAVANRYDYDAFGNLEATSYETVANPFGFTARERDAESGLMFYRARYYDPKIGRFISQDPIGCAANDLNLYRYVFNGPITQSDPSGKLTMVEYGELSLLTIATMVAIQNIIDNPIFETVPSTRYAVDYGEGGGGGEDICDIFSRNCDFDCALKWSLINNWFAPIGYRLCLVKCALLTGLCRLDPGSA